MYKLGVIGVGNMGGAIVRGVLDSGLLNPPDIILFEKNKDKVKDLIDRNIGMAESEKDLVINSENILLSVKPQSFKELAEIIKGDLGEEVLLISIAAGISLDQLEDLFDHKNNIRVMPNTPALVGAGMSAISHGENASEENIDFVKNMFSSLGEIEVIAEEKIDAFSGVAGCMPAFVYIFIEAAADAAVKNGLKREEAYKYVAQTLLGSAKMVLETGKHPGELKDQVTSPAGTTIRGVLALEELGFRNAIIKAVDASSNAEIKL